MFGCILPGLLLEHPDHSHCGHRSRLLEHPVHSLQQSFVVINKLVNSLGWVRVARTATEQLVEPLNTWQPADNFSSIICIHGHRALH